GNDAADRMRGRSARRYRTLSRGHHQQSSGNETATLCRDASPLRQTGHRIEIRRWWGRGAMSPSDLPFRRIVLEFSRSAHSAEAIQAAAELAELLHLDLLGRFVEDPGLAQLVRTP